MGWYSHSLESDLDESSYLAEPVFTSPSAALLLSEPKTRSQTPTTTPIPLLLLCLGKEGACSHVTRRQTDNERQIRRERESKVVHEV